MKFDVLSFFPKCRIADCEMCHFLFGFTDYPDYRTISLIDDEQISNENIIAITAECLIQVFIRL